MALSKCSNFKACYLCVYQGLCYAKCWFNLLLRVGNSSRTEVYLRKWCVVMLGRTSYQKSPSKFKTSSTKNGKSQDSHCMSNNNCSVTYQHAQETGCGLLICDLWRFWSDWLYKVMCVEIAFWLAQNGVWLLHNCRRKNGTNFFTRYFSS